MSTERNDGGPAFPVADVPMAEPETIDEGRAMARGAVSLRDYFAAKAMQSFYVGASGMGDMPPGEIARQFIEVGRLSYIAADAMLKARDA